MFGFFRAFLSLCVCFAHLASFTIMGQYAVLGFFVLSGYLMTLVMQEAYGYSSRGIASFALNRCLRLYPAYWTTIILTLIALAALDETVIAGFKSAIQVPSDPSDWLSNATLIYPDVVPYRVEPRLSPATWALTTELLFYALIGLGMTRSRRSAIWCLIAAAAYHIWTFTAGLSHETRYGYVFAAGLPFSVGACMYYYGDRIAVPHLPMSWVATGFVTLFTACSLVGGLASLRGLEIVASATMYPVLILSAGAVLFLASAPPPTDRRFVAFDRAAGDFSYHLYILHWIVGAIVGSHILNLSEPDRSLASILNVVLTLGLCAIASVMMTRFVDDPLQRVRKKVRMSAGHRRGGGDAPASN